MSDSEKMNTLDFVINVLREHEKTLDSLIEKLENALKNLPTTQEKTKPVTGAKHIVNILCEDWSEFKEACIGAEALSFQTDGELKIKSLKDNVIYEYKKQIYKQIEIKEFEIPFKLQASLDPSEVRRVLSKELNVPENRIVQGDIQFS